MTNENSDGNNYHNSQQADIFIGHFDDFRWKLRKGSGMYSEQKYSGVKLFTAKIAPDPKSHF